MLDTRHIKQIQNKNKAKGQFGGFNERDGGERTAKKTGESGAEWAQCAAAEAAPSAPWTFFCAAPDDDNVEANRQGALTWSRARNVAEDCITFLYLYRKVEGVRQSRRLRLSSKGSPEVRGRG